MKPTRRLNHPARACLVLAALACLTTAAHAQFVTTPHSMDDLTGNGGLRTPITQSPATWQGIIAQSELDSFSAGDRITGLQWRALSKPGNVPFFPATSAVTWPIFDIYVSSAATTPATMNTTFAFNDGPDVIAVRSGPFTLPPQAYFNNQQVDVINPWGPLIGFDTPFTYQGGDIAITLRHTGHSNFDAPTNFSLDSVFPFLVPPRPEYGILVAGLSQSGYTATGGGLFGFVVTRLQFEPIPEPATLTLLALAALGAIRLRTRRAKA